MEGTFLNARGIGRHVTIGGCLFRSVCRPWRREPCAVARVVDKTEVRPKIMCENSRRCVVGIEQASKQRYVDVKK